jgi:transcriptional antiterminator NusG
MYLVEMELDESTWHLVKETPRVMGFIGGKADHPAPISNAEAQAILQRVQVGSEKITPKIVFEPGEFVRESLMGRLMTSMGLLKK